MQLSVLAVLRGPGAMAWLDRLFAVVGAFLVAMLVGAAAFADERVRDGGLQADANAEEASEGAGAATQPPAGPGQAPRSTRMTVRAGDVVVDVRQDGPGEAGRAPRAPQPGQGGQDQSRKKKDKKDENPAREAARKIIEGVGEQDRPREGESAADRREAEWKNLQTMATDTDTNRKKAVEALETLAPEIGITPPDEGMLDFGTDDELGDF